MEKVGIIGYGNMGRAIAERIKDKYAVVVFDKDKHKISNLKNTIVAQTLAQLVEQSEIIILAVKPQDFVSVLDEIKSGLGDKLIITIAAGICTDYIKSQLGQAARVARIMPNLPSQIGKGVSVISKELNASENNLNSAWHLAYDIFSNLGAVLPVDKEEMINAATAISGSGPAFFCHYVIKENKKPSEVRDEFVDLLTQAAVNLGFDKLEAQFLSAATVDGTIAMLIEKHLTCAELINMVASKGGTTEAGLEVLNSAGSIKDATEKAAKRAGQLEKRS
jgi:pyrroline-5-carboxylate reductase